MEAEADGDHCCITAIVICKINFFPKTGSYILTGSFCPIQGAQAVLIFFPPCLSILKLKECRQIACEALPFKIKLPAGRQKVTGSFSNIKIQPGRQIACNT